MSNAFQSNAITKSSGTATIAAGTAELEKFLEARGLDAETAYRYGIAQSNGSIVIPYQKNGEIVNRKYRSLTEKKFWQDGGKQFVWNYDVLLDDSLTAPLLITEGEFDCLAAIQAGHVKAISIPNGGTDGNVNLEYLDEIDHLFPSEIILGFDNDDVGHNLLEKVSNYLGKARCKFLRYPKGCKDLNDALMKYGIKGVTETLARAEWISVKGHYKMSEIAPVPYRQPMLAGMGKIDDHIRLRLGDFSVWTGIPGHGKTTFINDYMNRIIERYNLKICFASFEQNPQTDHKRALRTWHSGKLVRNMGNSEIEAADEWIDKRYMFIVPDESETCDLKWLIEQMEIVVLRHGVSIIVIDPWNEMEHVRESGESLTEYTGRAIRHLKAFAKNRGVHVAVVAHPAKMLRDKQGKYPVPTLYDISDSAHWANKADLGIVVHRCAENGDTVRNVKSRYHNEIGAPEIIDVTFNLSNGRFTAIDREVFEGKDKGR